MRIPLIPRILKWLPLLATCAWLAGCATAPGKDYSAYRAAGLHPGAAAHQ